MLRKFSKLTGGRAGRLDLKRLLCLRQKQKAVLRVRVMQRRRARMLKARQRRNKELIRAGPKSLNPKGTRQETLQDQAKAIASFLRGIWETEGTYHHNRPVLNAWKAAMRARTDANPNEEPPDRERAWHQSLKKMSNWTAPGPDAIPSYWWKTFTGMAT